MNNMWSIHTVEYHSAVNRDEVLARMSLRDITLSERS